MSAAPRLLPALALMAALPAQAAPDGVIPVQGRLTDADGQVIDETLDVRFALYDAPDAAVPVWEDAFPVTFDRGSFTARLGADGGTLDLALFAGGPEIWLGVTIADDVEMDLVPLGHVPYAAWAERAGDADTVGGRDLEGILSAIPGDEAIEGLALGVCLPADYAPSWDAVTDLPPALVDGEIAWDEIVDAPVDLADGTVTWSEIGDVPADIADGDADDWSDLSGIPMDLADGVVDWTEVVAIPAALADGLVDWSEITSVPAVLADGAVDWSELSGLPADLSDGVVSWSEVDAVPADLADGVISWTELDAVPADLLDGDATLAAPSAACDDDEVAGWDGTAIVCEAVRPTALTLRGTDLTRTGSTLEGAALDGGAVVATGGGYGTGTEDLVLTSGTLVLEPGVHEYEDITLSGTARIVPRAWNGADGGKVILRARGTVSIGAGTAIDASGRGYRGGRAEWAYMTGQLQGTHGQPGESILGWYREGHEVSNNNVSGGGGGGGYDPGNYGCGGAGGGYGTAGANGPACPNNGSARARGGFTYGDSELQVLHLGSGGGASGSDEDHRGRGGHGGHGGGAILIEADTIEVRGDILADGANGSGATISNNGGGGGGSGGSILLRGETVTIFSGARVRAEGGSGGAQNGGGGVGGAGGDGRIYVEAGTWTASGTVAPTPTVDSGAGFGEGDGAWSRWTSDGVSFTGDGRFARVDLFAERGPEVDVYMEFRAAASASALASASWTSAAPSGAVDAAVGHGHGQVRVTVWDRGSSPSWALEAVRFEVAR